MKPLILGPCDMRTIARRLGVAPAQAERLPCSGGTNITNLAMALIRRGIAFDLGTLSANAVSDVEQIEADPVTLWVARSRPARRLRDAYRVERRNLQSVVARSDCTVVNAHWTYVYGLAVVKGGAKPYVVTVHDCPSEVLRLDTWRYLPHYLMAAHVIRKARHLAAVSPYVQEYLRRTWRREGEVIQNVLPEGMPERAVAGNGAPILVVGHAAPHKNVRLAVLGFQEWRRLTTGRQGVRLRLIGGGLGPGDAAQRWAAARGVADKVEFAGERTPEQTLHEVASARFLLSASLTESWSLAVAEAMAIGTPVLAAREAGGVRHLLGHDGGMLVSGRSEADIASGISRMFSAPVEALARAERARTRIRELCSEDAVIRDFLRVLTDSQTPGGARGS
jgi:glycosyltransferase involved in cell wall biosynthesis